MQITPELLAQAIQMLQSGAIAPKGQVSVSKKSEMLSNKDKALKAGFTRKGFKDVVLMDRNDPTKPFNVRPFNGWIKEGRIVRKGERGVRGLFHISQTEPVTAAPKEPKEGKAEPKAAVAAGGMNAKTLADLAAVLNAKKAAQATA